MQVVSGDRRLRVNCQAGKKRRAGRPFFSDFHPSEVRRVYMR